MSVIANSSQAALYIAPQSAEGTIPETPSWTKCRMNGDTLSETFGEVDSKEIRSDRQPTGKYHTTTEVSGDITTELSYGGATDTLMQYAMQSTWGTAARTVTASTISTVASTNTIHDSAGGLPLFRNGEPINMTGIAELSGVIVVSSTVSDIVISGATLTDISEGTETTISSVAVPLGIGTTRTPFMALREFGDLAVGSGKYQLKTDCYINSMKWEMAVDGLTTLTFSIIGLNAEVPGYTSVSYTAASTTDKMPGIGVIAYIDGTESTCISSADFTVDNGITTKHCFNYQKSTSNGRAMLTLNFKVGYTSDALYQKALSNETIALLLHQEDADGNGYFVHFPKVRLGAVKTDRSETNAVEPDITATPEYDSTAGYAVQIEKYSA